MPSSLHTGRLLLLPLQTVRVPVDRLPIDTSDGQPYIDAECVCVRIFFGPNLR